MSWITWSNKFNRSKVALLMASLILILGAISPWYHLPSSALDLFNGSLALASAGRILTTILTILSIVFFLVSKPERIPRLLFWCSLIAVLLFPYLLTTWFPTVTFLAVDYQHQIEEVTRHIEENFSEVQAQWKQNILLSVPTPPLSSFSFQIQDTRFFQLSALDQIIREGLGYHNSFFAFIGQGWSLTAIGLVIALISSYLAVGISALNALAKDVLRLLFVAFIGLGIFLFFSITINTINYQLDTAFSQGDYQKVVNVSHALIPWYPSLRGDESFLKRLTEAEFYQDEAEPALLAFVKGINLYQNDDFLGSEQYFRQSLMLQPNQFLVRGYLATTILRQGVEDFNANRYSSAIEHFEEVLQIFPDHIQSLYDLMLARAVNGEFERSATVAQHLIEMQQYLQFPSLALLGQAHLHSSWASYHKGDMTQAWTQYMQSVGGKP